MPAIRSALCAGAVDPKRLTCAERRQHSGWLRCKDANAPILALAGQGIAVKEIVRRTGRSRRTVRGGPADIFRGRMNSLAPFAQQLEAAGENGCRNGAALWRQAKAAGFGGSLRVVTEWATRQRTQEVLAPGDPRARKSPSAHTIARMMTAERARSPKAVTRTVALFEKAVPDLAAAA